MQQTSIVYQDGKHKLIGQFIYDDTQKQQKPGIVIFPAFEGIAEFAIHYGQRLAEQGYAVLVADMYGDGKTANTIEGCFELITPFLEDRSLVRRRAQLAFDTLIAQPQVDTKKIGSMGFCFGGMCVLELARSGANLTAAVLAHGILKKSDLSNKIHCKHFLLLQGYQDPQVPADDSLREFAQEMQAANINDWSLLFFGSAQHSFTDPKTGSFNLAKEKEMGRKYDKIAADRTVRYAVDFFNETL